MICEDGLVTVENMFEASLDEAKEMYDRMCAKFKYTDEEKFLMRTYKSLFPRS
jgi:hypothetical protein